MVTDGLFLEYGNYDYVLLQHAKSGYALSFILGITFGCALLLAAIVIYHHVFVKKEGVKNG